MVEYQIKWLIINSTMDGWMNNAYSCLYSMKTRNEDDVNKWWLISEYLFIAKDE